MLDIIPDGVALMQRVNLGDSLVMQETIPAYLAHLEQFTATDPEKAASLQTAALDRCALNYGYCGPRESEKPFIYRDGVAVIPVHGMLLNRFNSCWGFATGYNFIRAQLNLVLDDIAEEGGDVKLLALDVDSEGGEAVGCFELCQEIEAARQRIQIISVVDSLAASGGYAIASAATRMVCTPSGTVGSIGVYRLHVDMSENLKQRGIKYTIFQAGEHKTDMNPFGPPSAEAAKDTQRGVEKRWDEFIALVAQQRDLDPDAVRATQARVYRADEALALRLIDAVNTPSEAVSEFLAELASDEPFAEDGDDEMALPKNQAELDQQLAAARELGASSVQVPDVATATAAAVAADRQRRTDIMALPEAEKRQKLAGTLANGDYTVDQAKSLLAAAAEEVVAAPVVPPENDNKDKQRRDGESESEFMKRMDKDGGPGASAGGGGGEGGGGGDAKDESALANSILSDQARFAGAQHRTFKLDGAK